MSASNFRIAGIILLLTAIGFLASPVLAADKVSVRVGLHANYGRLVLEWPGPVKFTAVLTGDEVKIEFQKELQANLATVRRQLAKYVSSARIDNAKSLILKLKRPVRLRSRAEGRLVIVDLVDKAAVIKTVTKEKVTVRGGEHPGRSRLVFDWNKPSGYKVSRSKNGVSISFARSADFNTARLRLTDLSKVSGFSPNKDGRRVDVSVPANVSLKHFTAGSKVVLDFRQDKSSSSGKSGGEKTKTSVKAAVNAVSKTATQNQAGQNKTEEVKTTANISAKKNENTKNGVNKNQPLKLSAAATKTKAGNDPKGVAKKYPQLAKGTIQIGAAGDLSKLQDAVKQSRLNAKDVSEPVTAAAVSAKKDNKTQNNDRTAANERAKTVAKSADEKQPLKEAVTKTAATGGGPLSKELLKFSPNSDVSRLDVYGDEDEKSSRVIFPWQRPVAAAAFTRLDHVWVVFAQYADANLDRVSKGAPSIVFSQQLRNRQFTVLRFRARAGLFPRMRREQAVWILEFSGEASRLHRELTPVVRPVASKGAQVYLPSLDNGDKVVLRDPDVGDVLFVVPTMVSGAGIPGMRRFVDFDLLTSLQGIVVRPKSDGVFVESKRERVLIMAKQGLVLSNPGLSVSADDNVALGVSGGVPLMDLSGWRGNPDTTFVEKRSELQNVLALSPPGRRNEMRMKLARMLIGYGFGHETSAVLQLIDQDDPSYGNDPQFLAVRGISKLFSGWLPEAEKDLMSPVLDKFPDIYLWRAMLSSEAGDFKTASKLFPVGANHLQEQPSRLQKKLLLNWLRTTAEVADDSNFDATVAALQPFKSDPVVTNAIAWLQGRQAQRRERLGNALAFYDQAIAAGVRPYSVYARRDRIKVRMQLEQIGYPEAMDELERLRFAWRGDDFELEVTAWLADLNFEQKEYRRGLKVLQEAVKSYPKSELTGKMTRRMREIFADLFLEKKADQLKPISALTLYYDFQELTPLGRKGDEMIRQLADRLANVDLLDRAATLLEHQVRFRLKGQEKSRVATRLAVIYLLDNRPKKALQTLKDSEFGLLPAELLVERRHLQVRALAEIGKIKPALALLESDTSDQAKQLRIDIHWNSQNWPAAALTLDGYLGRRWEADLPLTLLEQRQVIQLAITRYLSDDAAGLVLVKDRYGSKMKASPYYETFRVITHNIDPAKTSFRDLAPAIAGIPDFEAFMTSYRKKIRDGGVSALN